MSSSEVRIAHVLNTMGPGGVPAVALELLSRLPNRYVRQVVCLARRDDQPEMRALQAARFEAAGLDVRFPLSNAKSSVVDELTGWFRDDGVDLVHTHSFKPNRFGRLAALQAGNVRVVAHYHNDYADKWADPAALALERELAAASDALVACSVSVREHVSAHLGLAQEQITVIPNGVDAARFSGGDRTRLRAELRIPPGAAVVGTVGRTSTQKAHDDFLRAAALIRDQRPDTVFLVVGGSDDPELTRRLHTLAAELGLAEQVRFTGYRSDLADVYAALDVFVLSSHWEGFGLVLVEAMAAGRPVVTTDVGPVADVVGREGAAVLVPPAASDRLAAEVLALLGDPARASRVGLQGEIQARRWTWDTAAASLQDLYDRVLAAPPPRSRDNRSRDDRSRDKLIQPAMNSATGGPT